MAKQIMRFCFSGAWKCYLLWLMIRFCSITGSTSVRILIYHIMCE